jgi:type IV pilus assembly protein PilB
MPEQSEIIPLLKRKGVIDDTFIALLQAEADRKGVSPFRVLAQETELGQDTKLIIRTICEELGYDYMDLSSVEPDPESYELISRDYALKNAILPVGMDQGALQVVVPLNKMDDFEIESELREVTRENFIHFAVAPTKDIRDEINRVYRADQQIALLAENSRDALLDNSLSTSPLIEPEVTEESSIVTYVNMVLAQAIRDKASDIHFDSRENHLLVRYRIDGVMHDSAIAPREMQPEIISRLKIMSRLDPSNTRTPQDGRISQVIENKKIDFRVAVGPTIFGEKVVLRVLDNSSAQLPLTSLGFSERNLDNFRHSVNRPHGLVLLTGPTGSGKSTTLYAALNEKVSPEINIITVEDPVEYRIDGINQIEINNGVGRNFGRVLRSVLRQDPDVILIGEIRDFETAQIAIEAGLTGHMVYSTLHTNTAAGSLTRLVEMGIQPYLVASTLECAVSQRLVRKLCNACKELHQTTPEELDNLQFSYDPEQDLPLVYVPHEGGCRECSGTGFRGRVGIHEVMTVSPEIERAVVAGEQELEIQRIALEQGMKTLRQDGYEKVSQGITSFDEVLRVAE